MECLEFESISGWIQEEHGGLFTDFAFEADVRFDREFDSSADEPISEEFPIGDLENNAKMRNGHIMAVDPIVMCRLLNAVRKWRRVVGDDLVAKQIEVDPGVRAAALWTIEYVAIETASLLEVMDWEGEMKWTQFGHWIRGSGKAIETCNNDNDHPVDASEIDFRIRSCGDPSGSIGSAMLPPVPRQEHLTTLAKLADNQSRQGFENITRFASESYRINFSRPIDSMLFPSS